MKEIQPSWEVNASTDVFKMVHIKKVQNQLAYFYFALTHKKVFRFSYFVHLKGRLTGWGGGEQEEIFGLVDHSPVTTAVGCARLEPWAWHSHCSPMWVVGTQILGSSSAVFPGTLPGTRMGTQKGTLRWGLSIPSSSLTTPAPHIATVELLRPRIQLTIQCYCLCASNTQLLLFASKVSSFTDYLELYLTLECFFF